MAAKSKVITLLLFFVMFVVNACTHGGKCSLDEDMVNLIEGYRDTFCTLGIKHFQLRTNYYICEYNNCFSYIVSCDGKIIRDVQNNLTVISQNALEDKDIPDSMRKLSLLVISLYANEVKCMELKSDTIIFEKFDGLYLTNHSNKDSLFIEISNGWFARQN